MDIFQFKHSQVNNIEILLTSGCYEYSCYDHLNTGLCKNISFHFFKVNALEKNC